MLHTFISQTAADIWYLADVVINNLPSYFKSLEFSIDTL